MRIIWFAGSVCAALMLVSPAHADSLTLEEYLSQVREANPAIQSAQFRARMAGVAVFGKQGANLGFEAICRITGRDGWSRAQT